MSDKTQQQENKVDMKHTTVAVAGFPITHDVSLRKHGEHEGVRYLISNHGRVQLGSDYSGTEPSGGTWCYYVFVNEAMLPPALFDEFWLPPVVTAHRSGWPRIHYDYFKARFCEADWHGGVTFYEKLGGLDGERRHVKIGCDFAHSWDEGKEFDLDQVKAECIATINQLRTMYAFYRRCSYFGTYHAEADMVEKNGRLWSQDGAAEIKAESEGTA